MLAGPKHCIVVFLVLTVLAVGNAPLGLAEDEHPGKALFVKAKCNSCHTVESEGIEATRESDKTPDLSDAAALVPGAEWATKYIKREEEKDGKKHRRPYKGSDKDLDTIVAWLLTLDGS